MTVTLVAPAGLDVRPTGDRAREALFDILSSGRLSDGESTLAGAVVLDAFAGSGALGLEALSRGAASALLALLAGVTFALRRAPLRSR